jgi:quercetin dioxygenase-like cupin family protein
MTTQTSEIIDVRPLGASLPQAATTVLADTPQTRVMRLVVRKEGELFMHQTAGATTLLCLEGRVEVGDGKWTHELAASQLLCLSSDTPLALRGLEDSSLVSITAKPAGASDWAPAETIAEPYDPVEEASEESFPASDPPSFVARRRTSV